MLASCVQQVGHCDLVSFTSVLKMLSVLSGLAHGPAFITAFPTIIPDKQNTKSVNLRPVPAEPAAGSSSSSTVVLIECCHGSRTPGERPKAGPL